MLKIKDNVDLKVLENYGFHKSDTCGYLIETPIIDKYRLIIGDKDIGLSINTKTRVIYYNVRAGNVSKKIDLLFDMIQDGLVEKV